MDELLELLQRADDDPHKTAKDRKVGPRLDAILLDPISERVEKEGLAEVGRRASSSAKPQFIAERRFEPPALDELLPNLRNALDPIGTSQKEAGHYLGVTVCQAYEDPKSETLYPAHVRWGFWTHSPKAAKKITGPFQTVIRHLDWPEDHPIVQRPVTNMKSFHLSLLGGLRTREELSGQSLPDLIATIADDLVKLASAVRA